MRRIYISIVCFSLKPVWQRFFVSSEISAISSTCLSWIDGHMSKHTWGGRSYSGCVPKETAVANIRSSQGSKVQSICKESKLHGKHELPFFSETAVPVPVTRDKWWFQTTTLLSAVLLPRSTLVRAVNRSRSRSLPRCGRRVACAFDIIPTSWRLNSVIKWNTMPVTTCY